MQKPIIESLADEFSKSIKKPMDIYEICQEIQGGEYNAELMMQHLVIFVAQLGKDLLDPEKVKALAIMHKIKLPQGISCKK